jgi:hypothetical protein
MTEILYVPLPAFLVLFSFNFNQANLQLVEVMLQIKRTLTRNCLSSTAYKITVSES